MSDRGRPSIRAPRLPWISVALMVLFQVGGSLGLLLDWPAGPAHINWGVWLLVPGGYLFLIAAAVLYVKTGR